MLLFTSIVSAFYIKNYFSQYVAADKKGVSLTSNKSDATNIQRVDNDTFTVFKTDNHHALTINSATDVLESKDFTGLPSQQFMLEDSPIDAYKFIMSKSNPRKCVTSDVVNGLVLKTCDRTPQNINNQLFKFEENATSSI